MQNINNPQEVARKRRDALPLLQLCHTVATYQVKQGKWFVIENPATSAIWQTPQFREILLLSGVGWDSTELCMHGLKDPVSKLPYRKSISLLHNLDPDIMAPVFIRSQKSTSTHVEHEPVEGNCPGHGSRTKISQVYPRRFCTRLAEAILNQFRPSKNPGPLPGMLTSCMTSLVISL